MSFHWYVRLSVQASSDFGYPVVCTHQDNIHIAWWVQTTV